MKAAKQLLLFVPTAILYVAACAAPAIQVDEGGHACTAVRLGTLPGLATLLLGWLPPFTLPWLANPLLLVGGVFLLLRKPGVAVILGGIAVGLGLTTWVYAYAMAWKGVLPGYYLWQGSLVTFTLAAWVVWHSTPPRQPFDLEEYLDVVILEDGPDDSHICPSPWNTAVHPRNR